MSDPVPAPSRRRFRVGPILTALVVIAVIITASVLTRHHSVAPTLHESVKVYEFFATPSQISCELDNAAGRGAGPALTEAYCTSTTVHRTQNVRLSAHGTVTTCVGPTCGSNAGLGTPTLARGTVVTSGPFRCEVAANSVSCKITTGQGFSITSATIIKRALS